MKEALKHRLIGAAVIAAVVVLFLPSFFKDRQAYDVDTSSQIPNRPSITAVDFNDPQDVDGIEPAPSPETMFVADESEALPIASTRMSDSEMEAISASSNTPQSPIASKVTTPSVQSMPLNAKGLPDAWVIQVAGLSSADSATKLRDQLQVDGYKAYVRSGSSSGNTIYRVFVGPLLDKSEAISLKSQLDKRLKVNSMVLPFKP